jgi:hypothetical protein
MARATFATGVLLALAACSFPDVTFTPAGEAAGAPEGAPPDDSSDATTPGDAAADDARDGAAADVVDDYRFEASPDAPVCDQDEDKHPAIGGSCGGLDCDDHDPRAYDGEPSFLTFPPTKTTGGDWNCDHIVEKQYTPSIACNLLALGSACDGTFGFQDNPPCGGTGMFVHCASNQLLNLCGVGSMSSQVQGCK